MAYTPEQINRLKQMIHDHLEKNRVFDLVKEMLEKEAISEALSQEKIIETLGNQGVLGDVVNQIAEIPDAPAVHGSAQKYILFKVQYGKAFVDFVAADPNAGSLQVHVSFLEQRFSSKSVPLSSEPVFDESFLLNLSPPDSSSDVQSLLKLRAPIHLVLTKEVNNKRHVVASKTIEWRLMLSTQALAFPVELMGRGTHAKMTIGVLHVSFDLMPRMARHDLLTDRIVNEQVSLEQKHERDSAHAFFEYTNEWWRDYKQIRPTHENRIVKIYAETEDGSYKPVCSLVRPLRTNRLLDSPLQAARLVSLIPFQREEVPGGLRNETWNSLHTFLCKKAGDSEEHSVLLAGLLLGFGLEAYVAVGTSGEGPHAWVVTRAEDRVTFWESLTGQRLDSKDARVHRFYRKVGCVFNHKHFFGNIQVDDVVAHTSWDFEDESLWKQMAPEMLTSLTPSSKYLPLLPPVPNPYDVEATIEANLKRLISTSRDQADLITHWDNDLAYLLAPALANYELDRVGSVTYGNEEFQHSIKAYVPDGHTFKAFPAQFPHANSEEMLKTMQRAAVASDILHTQGDTVRFALRVKAVAYPEEITAVWVMLAVRYRSIT